ncbi:hypothetical protein QEV83_05730 [Methylocapsa sp. D3K7]|uniref:hypothetical protein n=1 Tax=Methylocapsa sp. D3K7 TaxID=3041435 RepID=UPI00244E85B5|nr:hypothetical protein [Methylocapsa sp. D3K7]WGJ15759.1 hypothetical protein QEV83_05730 [Methylocapsa sp. D3K7]
MIRRLFMNCAGYAPHNDFDLQESAGQTPMRSNSMPDLDKLMSAMFLVALLLYLVPAVFRLGESRQWFQRGAILTLGTAIAIAVGVSVIWFIR